MSRKPAKREHVYALLRLDEFHEADAPVEARVTVKKILREKQRAERELKKLNKLYANENCRYWLQETLLLSVDSIETEGS